MLSPSDSFDLMSIRDKHNFILLFFNTSTSRYCTSGTSTRRYCISGCHCCYNPSTASHGIPPVQHLPEDEISRQSQVFNIVIQSGWRVVLLAWRCIAY